MRASILVTLAFLILAGVLGVVLAGSGRLDLFIVLLLIGLLVLRELMGGHVSQDLTARLSIFIFVGLLAFAFIVVQRVREILGA